MMPELRIKEAMNGYIIAYEAEQDNGSVRTQEHVFEFADLTDERNAIAALFTWIADYYGYTYNKYSAENLCITWDKKGHKCE